MPAVSSRVAHRYAKSLIGLSQEKGVLEAVREDMEGFLKLIDEARDFELMLASPIVPHAKKFAVLTQVFEGKVNDVTFEFFKLITKKNREEALVSIANAFMDQYNEISGIQKALVSTAVELSDTLKKQFTDVVAHATGKKVLLEENVNEDLIGGYILRVEDRQIDNSMKSKLSNIRNNFK